MWGFSAGPGPWGPIRGPGDGHSHSSTCPSVPTAAQDCAQDRRSLRLPEPTARHRRQDNQQSTAIFNNALGRNQGWERVQSFHTQPLYDGDSPQARQHRETENTSMLQETGKRKGLASFFSNAQQSSRIREGRVRQTETLWGSRSHHTLSLVPRWSHLNLVLSEPVRTQEATEVPCPSAYLQLCEPGDRPKG